MFILKILFEWSIQIGTYKITFENYFLVVFGRTDIVRKFHPIALMLTSHEQTVDYQFFYSTMTQVTK